ncbi:uncharacterized protein TM35_000451200 [Trypanosoma theileri]|uniref:Mucin TcMUCII n=1 Tax=Trypanosoma theileri TaxID=67003 RepID=A0A1X0NI00_9TRYP|nr:uncharacterized protein TM35_000451200 [Trypanosoma theileri]ORC84382.1 hypothetical protein TM35_000451200 [Trypanosoma theileri]
MMMMMRRMMCVLAVVLCCACGYTMTAAATTTTAGQPKAVMAILDEGDKVGENEGIFGGLYEKIPYREGSGTSQSHISGGLVTSSTGIERGERGDAHGKQTSVREVRPSESESLPGASGSPNTVNTLTEKQKTATTHTPSPHPAAAKSMSSSGTTELTTALEDDLKRASAEPVTATTATESSEGVGSNTIKQPAESEKAPDNSTVYHGNVSQHSSPGEESTAPIDGSSGNQSTSTPGAAATSRSEETNTTILPNTENTVSEESTATPSRDSNLTQQSTATDDVTAVPNSPETNTTTPPSSENTGEAPTTTPSPVPVPNAGINTIASAVQNNKANVDSSSISPVWMRTAAPLLIVAVLVSATVY